MVVLWHCTGKEGGTKMSKFVGQIVGLVALLTGWTYGSLWLIFAGTFVLVMESTTDWGEE